MSIEAVFKVIETATAVLKPLIVAGVADNPKAEEISQKIFRLVNTATGIGMTAVTADRRLATRLKALVTELEAIKANGGVKKADMTRLSKRVIDAEAELQAVIARRQTQKLLAG
jgi:hypothetical protein